jgi:hypothetical protein
MNMVNYIYYCIYRFVLKTPGKAIAEEWAVVFLALTATVHAEMTYCFVLLATGHSLLPSRQAQPYIVLAMVLLIGLSFFHYIKNGNSNKVITTFKWAKEANKYAWIGGLMFFETVLLPAVVAGYFIVFNPAGVQR